MERSALADRFVNYADAASVFPLVQSVAFAVALSEPDIRCSIAEIWNVVAMGNAVFAIIVTGAVVVFRRAELKLRDGSKTDELVSSYLKRLQLGRFAIIWLSFAYLVFSAYTASLDPACSL